jgi:hypothetical protein
MTNQSNTPYSVITTQGLLDKLCKLGLSRSRYLFAGKKTNCCQRNYRNRRGAQAQIISYSTLPHRRQSTSLTKYSLTLGFFMTRASIQRLKTLWPMALALTTLQLANPAHAGTLTGAPSNVPLASGWQLQEVAKVSQTGSAVAATTFNAVGWYPAVVQGTVLTSLVAAKIYPEPLYGENNRPEVIPDTLARTPYWYRIVVTVPTSYRGHHVWLNFDGINYSGAVWVNGNEIGLVRGAFIRGRFDITGFVIPGKQTAIAVLIAPEPNPGIPHEHTIRNGVGKNGGITTIDGPTFLSTIGWDWMPAIHDRDTGIWQKVYLSATGPVLMNDPTVTTTLPLPRTDSATINVATKLENVSDRPVEGILRGRLGNIEFTKSVQMEAHSTQIVNFDPASTPVLRMRHPRLWWPNGYGAHNLYRMHLTFTTGQIVSDHKIIEFGIRNISYSLPGSSTLTISVNGVPIFIRGGNWGLDEAMKRIPISRLDAAIRLHKLAHLSMIRNWVGQSTSNEFYDLCDKYGLLVWDEFFQPNPNNGPDPIDIPTYIANVRDTILRLRNHPSIAVWCARNEGNPPPVLDEQIRNMLNELDPTRLYQASSTSGLGVRSKGPYSWREPREFYKITDDFFKTETGSVSIPTLESIHGMMPQKDWETINDDWAEHDFAKGYSGAEVYPAQLANRYGAIRNLADFVRRGQMANYEAFRAMFEGRNAKLFHPATGVITWMSNPAQPSFVWQSYHYDLEPMSSYFGVMHASELQHIQFNQENGHLEFINNLPVPLADSLAHIAIYDLRGNKVSATSVSFTGVPEVMTDL